LNLVGISESTKVNATFAVVAALRQVAIVVAVLVHVAPGKLLAALPRVLTGYADAFLAFSGLECITQFSPVMAEPRRRVTRLAMGALIATIALTSPRCVDYPIVHFTPANSNELQRCARFQVPISHCPPATDGRVVAKDPHLNDDLSTSVVSKGHPKYSGA